MRPFGFHAKRKGSRGNWRSKQIANIMGCPALSRKNKYQTKQAILCNLGKTGYGSIYNKRAELTVGERCKRGALSRDDAAGSGTREAVYSWGICFRALGIGEAEEKDAASENPRAFPSAANNSAPVRLPAAMCCARAAWPAQATLQSSVVPKFNIERA